jgi:hypothetical protein
VSETAGGRDADRETSALARARDFMLREARILDRRRFAHRFDGESADAVVDALRVYRNPDGGFGNALEPDLRGAASQPVPLEHALRILEEVECPDREIIQGALSWLATVSLPEGGVPFVLETVTLGPHAPWWVPTGIPSLNPTAGIAGFLIKHGVEDPWLDSATGFCWRALDTRSGELGPDDAISVLSFLDRVGDRERALAAFERLGERINHDLVALDPEAPGYVKSPLEFAPSPNCLARTLFDDTTIDRHLEALAAHQQDDGGWPITWEPPSRAAVSEWRGFVTLGCLGVLASYGRIAVAGT